MDSRRDSILFRRSRVFSWHYKLCVNVFAHMSSPNSRSEYRSDKLSWSQECWKNFVWMTDKNRIKPEFSKTLKAQTSEIPRFKSDYTLLETKLPEKSDWKFMPVLVDFTDYKASSNNKKNINFTPLPPVGSKIILFTINDDSLHFQTASSVMFITFLPIVGMVNTILHINSLNNTTQLFQDKNLCYTTYYHRKSICNACYSCLSG